MTIFNEIKSMYQSLVLNIKNSQTQPPKLMFEKGVMCSIEFGREEEKPFEFETKEKWNV